SRVLSSRRRPGSRRATALRGHDRGGEPRDGMLRPRGAQIPDGEPGPGLLHLPHPAGAASAAGGVALRRPATDGGHRARPDAAPPPPRLLLLDEPSLGLAPAICDQVFEVVAGIHADGVAVLLVEQNVVQALAIAARAYVLEQGRIVAEGAAADLARDPRIREAYLGQQ